MPTCTAPKLPPPAKTKAVVGAVLGYGMVACSGSIQRQFLAAVAPARPTHFVVK
jgi:hypothetical protein